MPPCCGCRLDSSASTAANGTKNSRHARIQSVTAGAPMRALREIQRSPTMATMFIATTSHSVRDVMSPVTFLVITARTQRLSIHIVLHFLKRAFPAAAHDLEIALPARAVAFAALTHRQHCLAAVAVRARAHLERHRADRVAVGRLPEGFREEERRIGTVIDDGAVKRAAEAAEHLVTEV